LDEGGFIHQFGIWLGSDLKNKLLLLYLKLLLLLAKERNISHLHIYGDSQLVINWMTGVYSMQNYSLQPLFQNIKSYCEHFSHITFDHVFRERNQEANSLSKAGLELDHGSWKIKEEAQDDTIEYFHESWLTAIEAHSLHTWFFVLYI
jgi:hypothetical protein